jgi:hypothetical protein
MTLILSGTDGLSDIDGSAATPAIRGTDANTGIFFPAADVVATATNGTEKSRTDSSGNYLLGTTSWSYSGNRGIQNRASGSDNSSIFLETDSATIKGFMASDPTASRVGLGSLSNHPLVFIANDSERARITGGGTLLIGKTNDASTTRGTSFAGTGSATIVDSQTGDGPQVQVVNIWSSVANGYRFFSFRINAGATEVGSISTNGSNNTSYNTSSDYRLKENVQPMTGALAKVAALKPVTYKWKSDGSDGEGFIAHELAEVVPQCVTGKKDAIETYTDEDGVQQTRPKYQGVDTSFLVATLTAAIQEQQAMIQELTAKVAALEAKG